MELLEAFTRCIFEMWLVGEMHRHLVVLYGASRGFTLQMAWKDFVNTGFPDAGSLSCFIWVSLSLKSFTSGAFRGRGRTHCLLRARVVSGGSAFREFPPTDFVIPMTLVWCRLDIGLQRSTGALRLDQLLRRSCYSHGVEEL